jgi:glycine/serine hydroxymethyltransferase
VNFIDRVLMDIDNEATITAVKEEVKTFMQQIPLYAGV